MPSTAQDRRDPQQGKKGFSTNKGFTVIELMIAVAVIAIVMSLALPSYRALIEKRQVTSSSQQLAAFLSAAQMESVKRNRPVSISCEADTGCEATARADEADEEDLSLRTIAFSNFKADVVGVEFAANDDLVIFDPARGMLAAEYIAASPLEIQLASANAMYAMNVRMEATGRVSMCSNMDNGDAAVPGYAECD